ncbi:unnamed protein product [Diabrotica balteata]|uniref:BED-type domain-containing protein n=1 Tax=Diabrotica balteata TaxID=107213 RepID=A0A9N9SXR4_DIABA|nr:unnamed protein product [Diabrotica balteata]
MSKSFVWNLFSKRSTNEAQCSICLKILKTGGGTTNLRQHLKNKHPKHLENKPKDKELADIGTFLHRSDQEASSSASEASVSSASFCLPSSSRTFVHEQSDQSSRSRSPTPSPSQKKQMTLLHYQQRNSSYERGGKRDLELTNALAFMIGKDNLPHSSVEKEGFAHFMKIALPLFKVPSRKTVTEILSGKYSAAMDIIRAKFSEVTHFSLTADICTVTNTSKGFLVITAHFIDPQEHNSLETMMLGVRRLRERHTGDYICQTMNEVLDEFGIPLARVVGICTDGGANMLAAVKKLLGEGKNVHCFAHILNLIVTDGLEDVNNVALKNLINEIKAIVTFARHSNLFMERLRMEQEREGKSEGEVKLLVQSVPTRWNSVYHMLQRFTLMSPYIAAILADPSIKKAPRMISGSDIKLITEIVAILSPFDEATKEISGSKYITASLVIPLVTIIERSLKNLKPNLGTAQKLSKDPAAKSNFHP